jgi:tryptophan synthase alpha chain
MSRIREKFGELKRSERGGFIPFITTGDPDLATTERLLIELAKEGADIIELGVPSAIRLRMGRRFSARLNGRCETA